MNEELKRFRDLLLTDETFQQKMKTAMESYTGARTEEEVFENVVLPAAKEAGCTFTLDDIRQTSQELDMDEMSQVAGGTGYGWGAGAGACAIFGIGAGIANNPEAWFGCLVIGMGNPAATSCAGKGMSAALPKCEKQED